MNTVKNSIDPNNYHEYINILSSSGARQVLYEHLVGVTTLMPIGWVPLTPLMLIIDAMHSTFIPLQHRSPPAPPIFLLVAHPTVLLNSRH